MSVLCPMTLVKEAIMSVARLGIVALQVHFCVMSVLDSTRRRH